jgi:outer membrane protein OmpA-like peptidoglycan-associated protein
MSKAIHVAALLGLLLLPGLVTAQAVAAPLAFRWTPGDQFRYYGTGVQKAYINGQLVQTTQQTYKVSYSVTGIDAAGRGLITGHIVFLSDSDRRQGAKAISQEFDTAYAVDRLGRYTVPADDVMPVVRNVPTFLERAVKTGDTWTAKGEEVHDLREDFGVDKLLHVPIDVLYTNLGPQQKDGHTVEVIASDYNIYARTGFISSTKDTWPVLLSGYSHQKHFFNKVKGQEEGYEEEYTLVLTMNNQDVFEFAGDGASQMTEALSMNKPQLAAEVKKALADSGMPDVQVTQAEKGVVINLDNIQFPADSAVLLPIEQEKIRLIGQILKKYPDRDILVEGHTALAGTAEQRQRLSQDRAAAVGNQLVRQGVRTPEKLVFRGWGADHPVAPNDSEANKQKNRRVEITILEN